MIYGFNDKKEKKDVVGYPDYTNKLMESIVEIAYPDVRYVDIEFDDDGWAFFDTSNNALLASLVGNTQICSINGTVAIPVTAGQSIRIMAPTEYVILQLREFGMK